MSEEIKEMKITLGNMFMSDKVDSLALALSKAQSELGSVHKGEKGYGYNYASLASTIETAKEPLSKNGLAVSQVLGKIKDGKVSITTVLLHESGQYLGGTAEIALIDMKGCNEAQSAGASKSYLRRYALQALLNMASEDNDASSGESPKKQVTSTVEKPKGGFGRGAKVK